MLLSHFARLISPFILVGVLAACSSSGGFFTSQDKAYRSQRETVDDLEIPPDLSSSAIDDAMEIPSGASASYSEYRNKQQEGRFQSGSNLAGSQVLPEFKGIKYMRDGDQRWLEIDAPPEQVWFRVVEFWRKNGLLIAEQNPATGVMTTDWLESRPNIKQGAITEFLRKTFDSVYSSATRDQFRVRIEPGEQTGTTDLFLTHRGMEEKLKKDVSGQADTTYWTPRPNEPETEAAMLRSLMVYLGASQEQVERSTTAQTKTPSERARLHKTSDEVELIIDEGFARAWRLTGVALDRVGFAVEDRDRSQGIYFVRYNTLEEKKKKGFFSRLAFWRGDEIDDQNQYQVKLESDRNETRVIVNDQKGVRQNSATAIRLLTLLHEQIR